MDKEIKNYLKECDLVRDNFVKINENVSKINAFLKENRCYKFEDLQNGVKPISRETDKIIQKINQKLKELHINKEDVERVTTANTKMKFMQYTSLREGFTTTLNSYIDAMKHYEANLEHFKHSIQKTVQGDDYDETQPLTGGDQDQLFIGNYLIEKHEAEQQLKDVEERHQLLLQIEGQLVEVKDLFIQIAILVDQQQESINRAEYHAAISTHAVEMANNDLENAKKKKRTTGKIKIILIISSIIIILILLIILLN
ncbi:syntaxin-1A-like isoform X2 [Onthophagus taurus]|nr:syntaxin-1A-like isoform X2 [Onthophagus taurus]XP_022915932.1 syntaxin-1A-like isoform X2 [Onthophagus taurus]